MTPAASAFAECLIASRLLTAEALREFCARWSSPPSDPELAQALVEAGLLTEYQATRLLAGHRDGYFIEKYKILDCLEAGWGVTFRAVHTALGQWALVRVLPPEVAADSRTLAEFQAQAQAVAALEHPHIVRTFDVGHDPAAGHFVVVEYVEGQWLSDYIRERDLLAPAVALAVAFQVAQGLEHARARGVVHYDTSARNILVTAAGVPRIADMGLARFFTPPNIEAATPVEALLEQLRLERSVDVRYAIACLGGTLYHMLTGLNPLPEESLLDALTSGVLAEVTPATQLVIGLPQPVSDLACLMMASASGHGLNTPADLLREIQAVAADAFPQVRLDQAVPAPARAGADADAQALAELQEVISEGAQAADDDFGLKPPRGMVAIHRRWHTPMVSLVPTVIAIVLVGVLAFLLLNRWINPRPAVTAEVGPRLDRATEPVRAPAAVASPVQPTGAPRPTPKAPAPAPPEAEPIETSPPPAPSPETPESAPSELEPSAGQPSPAVAVRSVKPEPSRPQRPELPAKREPSEPCPTLYVHPTQGPYRNLAEACQAAGPRARLLVKGRVVYREQGLVLDGKQVEIAPLDDDRPIVMLIGESGGDSPALLRVMRGRLSVEGIDFTTSRAVASPGQSAFLEAVGAQLVVRACTFSQAYRSQADRLAAVRLSEGSAGGPSGAAPGVRLEDCFVRGLEAVVVSTGRFREIALRHCLVVGNETAVRLAWPETPDEHTGHSPMRLEATHCVFDSLTTVFGLRFAGDVNAWNAMPIELAVRRTIFHRPRAGGSEPGLIFHVEGRLWQTERELIRHKLKWHGLENVYHDAARRWMTLSATGGGTALLVRDLRGLADWGEEVGSLEANPGFSRPGGLQLQRAQPRDYALSARSPLRQRQWPEEPPGIQADRLPSIAPVSPTLPRAPVGAASR